MFTEKFLVQTKLIDPDFIKLNEPAVFSENNSTQVSIGQITLIT